MSVDYVVMASIFPKNKLITTRWKPGDTLTLEEITGPVGISDGTLVVCSDCKNIRQHSHLSAAAADYIGELIKNMASGADHIINMASSRPSHVPKLHYSRDILP